MMTASSPRTSTPSQRPITPSPPTDPAPAPDAPVPPQGKAELLLDEGGNRPGALLLVEKSPEGLSARLKTLSSWSRERNPRLTQEPSKTAQSVSSVIRFPRIFPRK